MRLVVDANVFISALIARRGVPGRLLTRLIEDECVFLVSRGTMGELRRTLEYPKIQELLKQTSNDIERLLSSVELLAEEVDTALPMPNLECRDPKDVEYLAVAVLGRAECIVSGDKDLLVLESVEGIPIINPTQLLARMAN